MKETDYDSRCLDLGAAPAPRFLSILPRIRTHSYISYIYFRRIKGAAKKADLITGYKTRHE
ncbi:MAG: hypothetical protein K2R98_22570 [Gemmataceae bacterium]|nr:hypothetical protein [Gemmataceae bacterium]